MELVKCECEHTSHFFKRPTREERVKLLAGGNVHPRPLSPNGNPNHKYGIRFAAGFLRRVQTPWSSFRVCKDCREDCLSHYPEVKS